MQSIRDAAGQEFTWQQPHALERSFELRAGTEVVATLRWQKLFGTLAVAETADRRWTFKRAGFWRPRVTVRVYGSETDLAVFEPGWTGAGTLTVTSGGSYRWGATNIWHSQWQWSDDTGTPLVHFASSRGLTRMSARVELFPAGAALPDLPLLVTLGWYLLALLDDDSSGAVATTVATTSS